MNLLAHRGFWFNPEEKNTREAYRRAFAAGYGIELDVRDRNGGLVIAHDLADESSYPFADVLTDYAEAKSKAWLAINIKADGLVDLLSRELKTAQLTQRAFVFDMSVPDLTAYMRSPLIVFNRRSELEPASILDIRTPGVWLDFFEGPWVDPQLVVEQIWRGRKVAVVSSELHGLPYESGWAALKAALTASGLPAGLIAENLMLCTDHPDEASSFFETHTCKEAAR